MLVLVGPCRFPQLHRHLVGRRPPPKLLPLPRRLPCLAVRPRRSPYTVRITYLAAKLAMTVSSQELNSRTNHLVSMGDGHLRLVVVQLLKFDSPSSIWPTMFVAWSSTSDPSKVVPRSRPPGLTPSSTCLTAGEEDEEVKLGVGGEEVSPSDESWWPWSLSLPADALVLAREEDKIGRDG